MLKRLFPASLGNAYQGSWIAVWLLVPVLLMKSVIGFNLGGLNPFVSVADILKTADGVPMDTLTPDVARIVVSFANAWGVAIFMLCLFVWIVLLRYRSALPLAILLLLLEQLGRTGEGIFRLVTKTLSGAPPSAPGAYLNLAFAVILAVALLLSLTASRPAIATNQERTGS